MVPRTLYGMCRNLVTVNDCYGLPKPYMEGRNLVTVNDCYGPPKPYMECRNPVTVNDCFVSLNLIWNVGICVSINDL